ncbi:MAG: alpha-hydroxy-acid oxidizing enzyme [Betaproteobacteria bacterium RIFCSPLOWO2_12_FULL_62_13]|nr:MAG: alpha-hydroxy-acid oxidizing enzyme [Betaproteobacteria bacterium RIFCSPLOWO2_12_FULL_62_13]
MAATPRETSNVVSPEARAAPQPAVAPATPRILGKILSLDDFEAPARRRIPRPIFGYVASGAERDASLRLNRAAYDDVAFVPRVLVNTSARTQKTTVFGRSYDAPFGMAPMGGTSLATYQGDIVLAHVAAEANIPMILSGGALTTLESVKAAGATAWFQAYLPGDTATITRLVERVAHAGYETMCVTVDVSVAANLEFSLRSGFRRPFRPTLRLAWDGIMRPRWLVGNFLRTLLLHGMPHVENMAERLPMISRHLDDARGARDRLSWSHLEFIRRLWKGNLVIKGILSREDARLARESGADGIIVSNHGARQLDGAIAPLRALPAIAAEAGGMTVMIDSGIRRGTDVLKALGLGAKFVFLGRPFFYAAAVAGDAGVRHAIKILRGEIDRNMALLGITTLAGMGRDRLTKANSFDGL